MKIGPVFIAIIRFQVVSVMLDITDVNLCTFIYYTFDKKNVIFFGSAVSQILVLTRNVHLLFLYPLLYPVLYPPKLQTRGVYRTGGQDTEMDTEITGE